MHGETLLDFKGCWCFSCLLGAHHTARSRRRPLYVAVPLAQGYKSTLQYDDLFYIPPALKTEALHPHYAAAWASTVDQLTKQVWGQRSSVPSAHMLSCCSNVWRVLHLAAQIHQSSCMSLFRAQLPYCRGIRVCSVWQLARAARPSPRRCSSGTRSASSWRCWCSYATPPCNLRAHSCSTRSRRSCLSLTRRPS